MRKPKYKFGQTVAFMTSPHRKATIEGITNSGTPKKPAYLYDIKEWAGVIHRIPENALVKHVPRVDPRDEKKK